MHKSKLILMASSLLSLVACSTVPVRETVVLTPPSTYLIKAPDLQPAPTLSNQRAVVQSYVSLTQDYYTVQTQLNNLIDWLTKTAALNQTSQTQTTGAK